MPVPRRSAVQVNVPPVVTFDDPHEIVETAMEQLGFPVERIPEEPDRKTPDFLCESEQATYVIELKTRFDDEAEKEQQRVTLESGGVHGFSQGVSRRNTVSGIVADAVDQLSEWDDSNAYRLGWFHADDHRETMKVEQFKSSLLGMVTLFSKDLPHTIECMYFDDSDFFRHRTALDGAIVTSFIDSRLKGTCFLNNHAQRYGHLKDLELPKTFKTGLFLPDEREDAPGVLIADTDIDRRHQRRVLNYLRTKYDIEHLQRIDLAYHEGSVLARPEDGC